MNAEARALEFVNFSLSSNIFKNEFSPWRDLNSQKARSCHAPVNVMRPRKVGAGASEAHSGLVTV